MGSLSKRLAARSLWPKIADALSISEEIQSTRQDRVIRGLSPVAGDGLSLSIAVDVEAHVEIRLLPPQKRGAVHRVQLFRNTLRNRPCQHREVERVCRSYGCACGAAVVWMSCDTAFIEHQEPVRIGCSPENLVTKVAQCHIR